MFSTPSEAFTHVVECLKLAEDHAALQKVICVAVGSVASWDLYETPTQMPQGRIGPSIVFLAPSTLQAIEFAIRISVSVAGFDPVELTSRRRCSLVAA